MKREKKGSLQSIQRPEGSFFYGNDMKFAYLFQDHL